MLLYALVDGVKRSPCTKLRGQCPACGGEVLAKCGSIRVHHWAHVSGDECDSWSEGIGPWHLGWQSLVRPEFVETPIGSHRADILGDGDVVIELQHSPISPGDIEERERHYGNMLWLIDATARFAGLTSGPRFFFSFGRLKHLEACRKPVVLDFGSFLVEVEAITDVFNHFSGFGLVRDRAWFVDRYLASRRSDKIGIVSAPVLRTGAKQGPVCAGSSKGWRLTRDASVWLDGGIRRTYPPGMPYILVERSSANRRDRRDWPLWWDVISRYPDLANGWTQAELRDMLALVDGTPVILDGLLRLVPGAARDRKAAGGSEAVTELLRQAEAHMNAGRMALIPEATRQVLQERARDDGRSRMGVFLSKLDQSRGHRRWLVGY